MQCFNSLSRVLTLAVLLAGPAAAADGAPSGTWRHVEPTSAGPRATEMLLQLSFAPNGYFETHMRASGSQSSGSVFITTGRYWKTGANSYIAAADVTMACAGPGSCRSYADAGPAPTLGLGTLSTLHLERAGNLELIVNGQRWLRVH